jgi:predicted HTH transcriptional regulator
VPVRELGGAAFQNRFNGPREVEGSGQRFYSISSQIRLERDAGESFTDRQKIVLNRFLDGFEGKLTARKWAAIGKCSIASAQRDISDLVERGILKRNQGGSKNTSYDVARMIEAASNLDTISPHYRRFSAGALPVEI